VVNIWPVEDPAGLNSRRSSMGLPAMEDYIFLLKKTYGTEVVWDKELSTEDANGKMYKKN